MDAEKLEKYKDYIDWGIIIFSLIGMLILGDFFLLVMIAMFGVWGYIEWEFKRSHKIKIYDENPNPTEAEMLYNSGEGAGGKIILPIEKIGKWRDLSEQVQKQVDTLVEVEHKEELKRIAKKEETLKKLITFMEGIIDSEKEPNKKDKKKKGETIEDNQGNQE